jgi:excisionase family DNA binding protein
MTTPQSSRFLTVPQVAEELATSEAQILALVKRGDLVAMKLGGRGQWRIERTKLEQFIQAAYDETERELRRRDAAEGTDQEEDDA